MLNWILSASSLLRVATTMTGGGRSLKERLMLLVKKPKTSWYMPIAAIVILSIAVGCTMTGSVSTTPPSQDQEIVTKWVGTLKKDPKNAAYNEAMLAYDAFLSGELPVVFKGSDEGRYVYDLGTVLGEPGIAGYCVVDANHDGIPELYIASTCVEVFSYADGKLVHWFSGYTNLSNGPTVVLEDGTIFGRHDTTGVFYYVTTFLTDGSPYTIAFDCLEGGEYEAYNFNGKPLDKETWYAVTENYRAMEDSETKVQWKSWTGNTAA